MTIAANTIDDANDSILIREEFLLSSTGQLTKMRFY